ncbi:hypothetical protein QBC37DRAFT_66840 [Rhypophila decipiens]|uniref:Uncharacterized protein n=1 Tax=Rhypophila decipiens TaxID=261697 RepID=A0AAN6XZR5_9PEZI|nr:hypothetical protein QBC37DRAFT_66840 [Rhypophila decipiens]
MRTTSLCLALGIAPLALCAPVPLVLVDILEPSISKSGPQHPPASVLSSRPPHALPRVINWGPDEDDANFETVIDNRPITPSADADPSVVLQAPRPIVTDYLMAISVKKNQGEKDGEQVQKAGEGEQQKIIVLPIIAKKGPSTTKAHQTEGEEEPISVAPQRTMPCDQSKFISREQSDIIIICLAVVFLFAVVLLETFGSFARRRREGAIKLEDEKAAVEQSNSKPGSLSVQADQQ